MFVLFISFIFVLNISASQTTENKNVPFKEKLRKSVTHLNEMLYAIEGKIKKEKEILSRISYKLKRKENPPAARTDTTIKPSSDDLLPKDEYKIDTVQTTLVTPAPMFTFATMFPSPPDDNYWPPTEMTDMSVITDFPVFSEPTQVTTTTTESLFMRDIKKTMKEDKHNYFTAFLARFTELIAIKKAHDTIPVINLMLIKLNEKVDTVLFDDEVGKRLTETLKMIFPMVSEMPPEKLKEHAMHAHFTLKNKEKMMTPEYNQITDFYGQYFNKTDGVKLFKALEAFYQYNNGRHTASEVCNMILEAALNPYMRVKETLNTTGPANNETTEFAVHVTGSPIHIRQYPVQVTQYPADVNKYRDPVHVPTTQYEVPSWRRNMEQNVKHFILKRPKLLLEKIKKHYENIQKNKNLHQVSRKQRLDQIYRKNGQLDKREQSRLKAYISSEEVNNHPKYYQDNDQNHMLHKIRKVSSYSDEEDHLINNLHDVLRHGNRKFVSLRKSGGDIIDKQTIRDLSSEADEEWVLKNNIYKVFEQK